MNDNTVLFGTKECERCDGAGRHQDIMVRHSSTIRKDDDLVKLGKEDIDCFSCNGFGYLSKNHTAYKSEAMAQRHKAKTCYMCNTHGVVQEHTVWYDCPDCRGQGVNAVWDDEGNTIPDNIDLFLGDSKGFCKDFFANIPIVVVTGRKSQTWGEHNIGRGIVSVTDYGSGYEHYEKDPDGFIFKVRSRLMKDRVQLIKLVNSKEDRRIAEIIVIDLSENGYSIVADNDKGVYGSLPATYADVVNIPIA